MRSDFFNLVIDKACVSMDVEREDVLHSNKEECVDARYLVIAVLSERLSDRQIAEVSGWSVQLVNKAKNAFSDRCKYLWGLKEAYKELSQLIEN